MLASQVVDALSEEAILREEARNTTAPLDILPTPGPENLGASISNNAKHGLTPYCSTEWIS